MSRLLSSIVVVMMLIAMLGTQSPARAQTAPGPFVKQAFDLLMDRFVVPPSAETLLDGGWSGALTHLKDTTGAEPAIGAPSFSGDRNAAWGAFQDAYPQLAAAGGPSLDQHALDYAIVDGMAKSLNSTHTYVSAAVTPSDPSYGGVGMQMSMDLFVIAVFPGTPAEAAGVRIGDRLIAVNGASVEGMTSETASTGVRGPVGSPVQLTFRRGSESEPVVLTATRAQIVAPWVIGRVLDGGIGLLRIYTFPDPAALGQFDEAMAALVGADVKALVIDVRGNPGGSFPTIEKVASRFIRDGAIAQCASRQAAMRTTRADGSAWGRDVPITVLVSERTSSGGESLASALRENGIGYLVGKHTFGSLGGADRAPLQDGSVLTVETRRCLSGQGQEIEHVGLEPDQTVELDPALLAEGKDSQLDAALTYLRSKLGQ
jgi:carboxyl-terminal processing protease